jgi:hypothetical protein
MRDLILLSLMALATERRVRAAALRVDDSIWCHRADVYSILVFAILAVMSSCADDPDS